MKEYVHREINEIKKDIKNSSRKVSSKVVRIKLNEVTTQLNKVKSEKKVNDKHILALMRSYNLKKELRNVTK
jgi:predicted nucleic acid-binding protein